MYKSIEEHITKHVSPTAKELYQFTSFLKEITIDKGQFLVEPGQIVKHKYFVIKGGLKAYYIDPKGNKHIIQFAVENWWVGDFDAYYNNVPSKLHIEVLEDSELLSIDYDSLQKIYDDMPIFERYYRILVTNSTIAQRKRILSSLEKNTQERYLEFCEAYANIENRVPNYDIANYLGVSPENLSRVRKQLKKLNIS
ncbi:Crp/Fnr family transcriptional regulator [Cellulophaga sp. 20_2_10]|uniref:Crp/Fnr family transcriptional regulator n=1 Tax=Cellulophaga sp. 20_2_10 TaxID=2942476 RepID=UPI00201AB5D8|nr:Crp/Fnr family transcriptional regulator [Cellulophaga sp. 20_2_10]MCL5244527.1 Crp/Fnr family transcriptional regulator [Cellulophaga sp. 20_2_10]